jgi:gliding motility-associated-like protein
MITRDELPTIADAGSNQTTCATAATLYGNTPLIGTGKWLLISGNALITSENEPVTTVNGLSGIQVFEWRITNGSCPASTDTVMIERRSQAPPAVAGSDQTVCAVTCTLLASAPAIGTGRWHEATGKSVLLDPTAVNCPVEKLEQGTNIFIWTVSYSGCPDNFDTVQVWADHPLSPADAGPDLRICDSTAILRAVQPLAGTGKWTFIEGQGSLNDPSLPSAAAQVHLGESKLRWTVSNGSCGEDSDEMQISRHSFFETRAGEDQVLETGQTVMNAELFEPGTGYWTVVEGSGTISDPYDPHAVITQLSIGNNVFKWTIRQKSCPETADETLLYVKPFGIPNAFSPNGDGINDAFIITSVGYYAPVSLTVFNRWGAIVYQNENYQNDWKGTNNRNEKLSEDTYYYIIKVPTLKNTTGFVIIKNK